LQSFCPLHIDLKNRNCLVIGGGKVAWRKVKVLFSYRAKVTVVSPKLSPDLQSALDEGNLEYIADTYRPAYLKDRFIVICATHNAEVNREAADACMDQGILVNSVSEPDKCTFFFPAVMKKGLLSLSISTAGSSPALARRIRDQLEENLPPEYGELVSFLHEVRPVVIKRIGDKKRRKELLEYLAGEEFLSRFKSLQHSEVSELVEKMILEIEDKGCERDREVSG
jgi:precorrin-2 dehydrogenase / sirohydrochlorin ferrochelatase